MRKIVRAKESLSESGIRILNPAHMYVMHDGWKIGRIIRAPQQVPLGMPVI